MCFPWKFNVKWGNLWSCVLGHFHSSCFSPLSASAFLFTSDTDTCNRGNVENSDGSVSSKEKSLKSQWLFIDSAFSQGYHSGKIAACVMHSAERSIFARNAKFSSAKLENFCDTFRKLLSERFRWIMEARVERKESFNASFQLFKTTFRRKSFKEFYEVLGKFRGTTRHWRGMTWMQRSRVRFHAKIRYSCRLWKTFFLCMFKS